MKKYKVIVADPPWQLKKIRRKVRPNQIKMDYQLMSFDDIKGLPVNELAAETSILFLWTIDKYLFKAKEVLESWGFKYHLTMAWDKKNGISLFGFNRRTEFVLVGFKGKQVTYPKRRTIKTSFSELSKKHSEKPDVFYEMIRVLEGKKIDLFARKEREGFDVWGNEVKSSILLKTKE